MGDGNTFNRTEPRTHIYLSRKLHGNAHSKQCGRRIFKRRNGDCPSKC
nr:hypothetical protein [Methanosarcina siciliae]